MGRIYFKDTSECMQGDNVKANTGVFLDLNFVGSELHSFKKKKKLVAP